jgi:hypothetical protein
VQIDGQCHCGRVRYEAEIDPEQVSICHCTDCQSLTGSAFRVTVLTRRSAVSLTGEEPRLYTKHGENGARRLQYFCGECGSPLFTTGDGADAGEWGIRWGSIRQRSELSPRRQIWCRSAVPWLNMVRTLPGTPTE